MKSCERQANYSHQLTDGKTETMADQQVQNRGEVVSVHLSPPPHRLGLKHNWFMFSNFPLQFSLCYQSGIKCALKANWNPAQTFSCQHWARILLKNKSIPFLRLTFLGRNLIVPQFAFCNASIISPCSGRHIAKGCMKYRERFWLL